MPLLLPVLLRLVTATSCFSLCYFLYGQQLKASRKKHRIQNSTEIDLIPKGEEANISTATHETNKPCGKDDSHGHLPISSFLRTHVPGGRTGKPGSGASCRASIGIASVSCVCHPRHSFSDTEFNTFGLLYLYQVVRSRKMQEQHFGEAAQACISNLEETLTEEFGQDGQSPKADEQKDPTIAAWPHSYLEEFTLESPPIEVQDESEKPNEELFDSATSMTFASDNEIAPPLESHLTSLHVPEVQFELFDSNRNEDVDHSSTPFEDSGNPPENLVCLTPESDYGIETLCYDEDSSTSEEYEDDTTGNYSGTLTLQQEREPSVYWNKDFQDLDWHQRTCSPIAEEPDEEGDELYQCLETSGSGSSITDSSSDLVFETIFSTSQNPEEINDNDLADLKDDPDFVQLLLQNNDHDAQQQWHDEEPTFSNDSDAEDHDEELTSSKETVLMLEDKLEMSSNESCDEQNKTLQTLEELASQLTKIILTEALCRSVDKEKPCKVLVQCDKSQTNSSSSGPIARMDSQRALSTHEICYGQVEQCSIENLASKLAKDIVVQVFNSLFGPEENLLENIVPSNITSFSEIETKIDSEPDLSRYNGQVGQSPIEDFASQLANAIIIHTNSNINDEEILSKKLVQNYKFLKTSSDTIARFDCEFDAPKPDLCYGHNENILVENMASQLVEDIITEAHRTVVNIDKLCTILIQTCTREAFREFAKLIHRPSPSSSIDSYALELATDICHFEHSVVNNHEAMTSSISHSIPEKLRSEKSSTYQQLKVPKSPIGLADMHPEMLSRSTQTDLSMTYPAVKKSLPSLNAFNLHPETISRIPRQLRHKVWKRLRKAKRKFECYTKHHEEPTVRVSRHVSESFVTQASDSLTALRALVLAHSLTKAKTTRDICILLDNEISPNLRQLLADIYDHVYLTSELCSHDDLALSLLGRPELAITYTKLHCWRLTQYQKCVYLDADTLVLQHCDELFDREELSAVPDTGWPDCFNSGVFVFRPSLDTYAKLVSLALTKGSFDGGDQGLLNTYFGTWRSDIFKRLPFIYNMVSNVSYTYAPAYLHFASGVKIVHFLGADKPWLVRWRTDNGVVELGEHNSWDLHIPFLQTWTGIFREKVLPKLSEAARSYVHKSTWMTVDQLLYRIAVDDIHQYVERSWTPDESLADTQFSSHTRMISHSFERAVSEPPVTVWQPPAIPKSRFSTPPPMSSSPQSEPPFASPPPPPPPPPHPEIAHHVDVGLSTPSLSTSHSEFEHKKSIIEEPSDPHWEALLWHSVQSPWEPPSPPPPEEYQLPPSQQYHEPCDINPTFGWYSSDSGAQSSAAALSEVHFPEPERELSSAAALSEVHFPEPERELSSTAALSEVHFPEPERELSQNRPEVPLLQDNTESSSEAEDQEGDIETTSGTNSFTRMRSWEAGNIDYLGKDKFENILKKLEFMFNTPDTKSELEDLKESLKDSLAQGSSNQVESVSSSLLLDEDEDKDEVATLVPDDLLEPEEIWQGYPEGDYSGMFEWQEGRIDYCGRDGSDNIMRHLDFIISGGLVQDEIMSCKMVNNNLLQFFWMLKYFNLRSKFHSHMGLNDARWEKLQSTS